MTQSVINLAELELPGEPGPDASERVRRAYDFAKLLIGESFQYWQVKQVGGENLLRQNETGNFAVVVKLVDSNVDLQQLADDPTALADFAITYDLHGRGSRQYRANALRKMRAVARTGQSTKYLEDNSTEGFDLFQNRVSGDGETDNNLPWGEFPYAGAVLVGEGDNRWLVGVSGYRKDEDHVLANFVGEMLVVKCPADNDETANAATENPASATS